MKPKEHTMFEVFVRDNHYYVRRRDDPLRPEREITMNAVFDLSRHLLRYQEDFIREFGEQDYAKR